MAVKKDKRKKAIDKKCNYKAWYTFLYGLLFVPGKILLPGRALGAENLPADGGYILAFNHRSWKEVPLAFYAVPGYMHFVAKEEHYDHAAARFIFPRMGAIAVDREKTDLSTIRKIVGVLRKGEVVGIFPEGTRNRDAEADMLQFKNGTALFAMQAKVPVVPVYIYKKPRFCRRNYLYIGKPLDVKKYAAGHIDSEKIAQCGGDIRDAMESAKAYLNDVMARGAYKQEFKAEKKRIKAAKKAAKKARKAAARAAGEDRKD